MGYRSCIASKNNGAVASVAGVIAAAVNARATASPAKSERCPSGSSKRWSPGLIPLEALGQRRCVSARARFTDQSVVTLIAGIRFAEADRLFGTWVGNIMGPVRGHDAIDDL